MKKKKTGFTLIELMVVIVIIGILATLGLVSFQNALRRSRNTRAIGDVKDFAAAQEQYKALAGIYYYTNVNACPTASGTYDYSLPTHPVGGSSYTCRMADQDFCISTPLENETGNCSGCTGAGTFNTTPGNFFCVIGKQ